MESTFASGRLTLFEHGGHTGNLCQPDVQAAILGALDGLGSLQNKSKKEASLEFHKAPAVKPGDRDFSQAASFSRK
jgi:hypothetical protein